MCTVEVPVWGAYICGTGIFATTTPDRMNKQPTWWWRWRRRQQGRWRGAGGRGVRSGRRVRTVLHTCIRLYWWMALTWWWLMAIGGHDGDDARTIHIYSEREAPCRGAGPRKVLHCAGTSRLPLPHSPGEKASECGGPQTSYYTLPTNYSLYSPVLFTKHHQSLYY